MRKQKRSGFSLTAGTALAALLQLGSGLWTAPALAQSVNTTSESTTQETTYNFFSPPGSLTVTECPFVGNRCPPGTTAQVIGSNVTVNVTTTIGPATVLFGDCQSQTLTVVPGGEDINTNVDLHTFVNCLASAVAVPTLSVWGLAALAAGLGAVALRRLSLLP